MDLLFLEPAFAWMLPALLVVAAVWRRLRRRHFVASTIVRWLLPVLRRPSPLRRLPAVLVVAGMALISVALTEPVIPFAESQVESQGLDIAIVLDLSASMLEVMNRERPSTNMAELTFTDRDRVMTMTAAGKTRLDATKEALREFIARRRDDRIGLLVFSDNAYVVSPLTFDYDYLLHYVEMVDDQILRGEGMTAIGDGMALATTLLERQKGESRRSRVIMVFTDGEHNLGRDPLEALSQADGAGIRVHLVGVDLEEEIKSKQAVQRLIETVESFGGRYFDADSEKQLHAASAAIDSLETGMLRSKVYVHHAPVFQWFALPTALTILMALGLRATPYFADFT